MVTSVDVNVVPLSKVKFVESSSSPKPFITTRPDVKSETFEAIALKFLYVK